MKKYRLLPVAVFWLAFSLSASGQQCVSADFTTPLALTVGNLVGGIDLNPACVSAGGQVSWMAAPGAEGWTVVFADNVLTDSQGVKTSTAKTNGDYYTVAAEAHSYSYSVKDALGSTQATGSLQTSATKEAMQTSSSRGRAKCDPKKPDSIKLLVLTLASNRLVLKSGKDEVDSICVMQKAPVTWNAVDSQIKAWTVIFKDQNPMPAGDIAVWSSRDPKKWHTAQCPACVSNGPPQHHRYQVVAIGTDGKVYRIDPDIIVDPGSRKPPLQ